MAQRRLLLALLFGFALAAGLLAGRGARAEEQSADAVGTIAYKRGHEIRLVESNGANDRRLWQAPLPTGFRGIRGLQWRPDGGALAFASDFQQMCSVYSSDIYTVLANGTGLKRITNSPACGDLAAFPKGTVRFEVENLTTESQFLVYVEGAPTAEQVIINPGAAVQITVSNVADLGNTLQQITFINGKFRWFDSAAAVDVKAGQTVSGATRFSLTGTSFYSDMGATFPTWQRTGAKIGFLFYEGIMTQIGANPAPGGADSLILAPGTSVIASAMSWSPTSDAIVYADLDHISIVQPGAANAGTPLIDKSATELVLGLDWLPDGSGFIMAVTGGQFGQSNSNIYEYNFAANEIYPITDFADSFAGGLSVSPNGQEIVFEYIDDIGDQPELKLIRRDGSGLRSLGVQGESPDWRPGTGIDFTNRLLLPMLIKR